MSVIISLVVVVLVGFALYAIGGQMSARNFGLKEFGLMAILIGVAFFGANNQFARNVFQEIYEKIAGKDEEPPELDDALAQKVRWWHEDKRVVTFPILPEGQRWVLKHGGIFPGKRYVSLDNNDSSDYVISRSPEGLKYTCKAEIGDNATVYIVHHRKVATAAHRIQPLVKAPANPL